MQEHGRAARSYPAESGSPSDARRFATAQLREWGCPAHLIEDAAVVVVELATNAVLHARTAIDLGITFGDDSIVVTVHDLDLARPEQNPYASREGGWGLGLVSALASSSAMDTHPDGGKTAWFRLPRQGFLIAADDTAQRPERRA